MSSNAMRVFAAGVVVIAIGIYAETGFSGNNTLPKNDPVSLAVEKGVKWRHQNDSGAPGIETSLRPPDAEEFR